MNWMQLCGVALCVWTVYALGPTIWMKYFRRWRLPAGNGQMLLSFDDGPDAVYTAQLLDLLEVQQVKAMFFLVAEKAVKHPELVARMQREGHVVALHCARHRNPLLRGPLASWLDFRRGCTMLESLTGQPPQWYRPPHGCFNLVILWMLRRRRMEPVLWTVMVQDWRADSTVTGLVDKLRRRCCDGDVLLLHDSGEGTGGAPGAAGRTLEALGTVLPELRQQYRFADLGRAAYGGNCAQ